MNLKHRRSSIFPDLGIVSNSVNGKIFQDLFRMLKDTFTNIFDDLSSMRTDRVENLPTASRDYIGRFMLKINAGSDDTLHVCIYEGATSTYDWRQVTIT